MMPHVPIESVLQPTVTSMFYYMHRFCAFKTSPLYRISLLAMLFLGWPFLQPTPSFAEDDSPEPSIIPILSNDEAWTRLPSAELGQNEPLPVWARALVDSLPSTTAAMLELDWLHRAASPLGSTLASRIRLTVAEANRCAYTKDQAEADLNRAGLDDREIDAALGGTPEPKEAQAAALEFARKLTLSANEITDDEVKQLADFYGDEKLVAMVLLIAYANFQDRLILALQLNREPNGPLPPVRVRFAKGDSAKEVVVPPREPPTNGTPPPAPERIDDPEWQAFSFDTLQQSMTKQRQRTGRIRVPTWDELAQSLPPNQRRRPPLRIRWSLVCRGYQPELANGWFACMGSFAEESKQDRVFEESVFWVITRTIHCFY